MSTIENTGEPVPRLAFEMAVYHLEKKELDQAIKYLTVTADAYKGSPLAAEANHRLGVAYEEKEDYQKAIQAYANAVSLGREEARPDYQNVLEERFSRQLHSTVSGMPEDPNDMFGVQFTPWRISPA